MKKLNTTEIKFSLGKQKIQQKILSYQTMGRMIKYPKSANKTLC